MIRTRKLRGRVCQGDVFGEVPFIEYAVETNGIIEVSKIVFPLVIVLSQDCDLQQDSKNSSLRRDAAAGSLLLSVLVAPLYNAVHVLNGEHLSELGIRVTPITSSTAKHLLTTNQNPRYHYFEFPDKDHLVPCIVDFKHYFSINAKFLQDVRRTHRVTSVSTLFREDISHRFASYLARIGLPNAIAKVREQDTR